MVGIDSNTAQGSWTRTCQMASGDLTLLLLGKEGDEGHGRLGNPTSLLLSSFQILNCTASSEQAFSVLLSSAFCVSSHSAQRAEHPAAVFLPCHFFPTYASSLVTECVMEGFLIQPDVD
jgi:hypothetical protein